MRDLFPSPHSCRHLGKSAVTSALLPPIPDERTQAEQLFTSRVLFTVTFSVVIVARTEFQFSSGSLSHDSSESVRFFADGQTETQSLDCAIPNEPQVQRSETWGTTASSAPLHLRLFEKIAYFPTLDLISTNSRTSLRMRQYAQMVMAACVMEKSRNKPKQR